MSKEVLAYRPAKPADLSFIVDSWVDSYKNAHAAGMISMKTWKKVMVPEVYRVLSRPGVEVWVAHNPSQTEGADIYGWLAVEKGVKLPSREKVNGRFYRALLDTPYPLVHYAYTKQIYRKNGIFRGLMAAARVDGPFMYTCKTGIWQKVIASKGSLAKWMPLLARYEKNDPEEMDDADFSSD